MVAIEIGLCITDLDVGGAERCLVALATGLDRGRFRPVVYVLAQPPEPERQQCVALLREACIETHFLGARTGRDFPRTLARLRKRWTATLTAPSFRPSLAASSA